MKIHTRKYRSIDVLLVAALLWAAFTVHLPAQSKPKPEPDEWLLPVCLGLVVIVVGGCVTYKLADFCDRRLPRTNGIPRTNTSHIVMQTTTDLTTWTTVFETNCLMDEFEYKPGTNLPCAFYRAMFP